MPHFKNGLRLNRGFRDMKASDVMVSNVITVGPDACVQDVAELLLRHRISAVPVIGANGEILGIVSEGDLINRPSRKRAIESPGGSTPWRRTKRRPPNTSSRTRARSPTS